jgi:limonene-1,2-epoxide hydrolase
MGTHEAVIRSFLDCLVAQDLVAALDHYADDAAYHVSAWREPATGSALRDALAREVDLSGYHYTIRNMASADGVAFIEVVDGFQVDGKDITMHWSDVWELNHDGKITVRRDYYDSKEYEAQLS